MLAAPPGPQTAPADELALPPLIVGLAVTGSCVLLVCVVRWLARPERLSLAATPSRPNRLNLLHVLGVLLTMWIASAIVYLPLWKLVIEPMRPGPAREAAEARYGIASWAVGSILWLALGLVVAARAFGGGLRRGLGLSLARPARDGARALVSYLAILPACTALQLVVARLFVAFDIPMRSHPVLQYLPQFPVEWKVVAAVSAVVLAPLAEEVCFRGLIQSFVRSLTGGGWWAILAASGMFALVHYNQPQAVPSLFALSVAVLVMRCCWAPKEWLCMRATRRSRGCLAAMARHLACARSVTNFCGFFMIAPSVSFMAMSAWIWLVPS